jgi:hypothetical protein
MYFYIIEALIGRILKNKQNNSLIPMNRSEAVVAVAAAFITDILGTTAINNYIDSQL